MCVTGVFEGENGTISSRIRGSRQDLTSRPIIWTALFVTPVDPSRED